MLEKIKDEPVLVAGLVEAVLALVVAFGFDLTKEQSAAILLVTGAVLALFARGKVVPQRKV